MSGVRAGRCWGGGEDGEDGRRVGGGGGGKGRDRECWRKREREWWTLEREEGREEWGISENRGTSLWCWVSRSDFCPFRIRFLLQSGSPKATERGGWIKRETFVFFFFSSGRNKKKRERGRERGTDHTSHLRRTVFFSPSFFQLKEINKG